MSFALVIPTGLLRVVQAGLGGLVVTLGMLSSSVMAAQSDASLWADIGRTATPAEIEAWDIDVRADFKGLPKGSGSVEAGSVVWEAQCESCHGPFAESGDVFTPLVGGTTDEDVERGQVANLNSGTYPHRTTLMKLSKISTLWDYISRAMPWNAPKSLSADEVYAVTAYILHLGDLLDEDFVLSNENIAQVQEMLPNRNGMVKFEPMWNVDGKPDVQGDDCMSDCETELEIRSFLPDYARDAHGNLADQNRIIGATRGAVTTQPKTKSLEETQEVASAITVAGLNDSATNEAEPGQTEALAKASNCFACHGINNRLVGPSFGQIAERYANEDGAVELLAGRVLKGGSGVWGAIPMPANAGVSDDDAARLVRWVLTLQN